jgi:hypothetical protein
MALQSPNLTLLDPEVRSRVQSELDSGERLLWAAQPDPRRLARASMGIVLFGIPWTAFACFWVFMASGGLWGLFDNGMGMPRDNGFQYFAICFPLFGLPFVLVGLGMLTAPHWVKRKAKRTAYAVTDRRVILLEGGFWNSVTVRTYMPAQLQRVSRTERPDGTGDLILEEYAWRDSDGDRRHGRHGLYAIPRVRDVEELIRNTLVKPNQRAFDAHSQHPPSDE